MARLAEADGYTPPIWKMLRAYIGHAVWGVENFFSTRAKAFF
jgi:hypothetical protein